MKILHTKQEMRAAVAAWKEAGESIGLVPTMGFLHEGHASLIRASVRDNDHTVVSVFVNPMQFSPGEDLARYPRDMAHDTAVCEREGADVIFHPAPEEMYGQPFYTYIDMNVIPDGLCGASRPAMFRGVCTVCSKLFHLASPDRAYFGKKDAQQLAVIRRMVQDLDFNLTVVGCESVREPDGLAMSSRNTYLSSEERSKAPAIYRALCHVKQLVENGEKESAVLRQGFEEEISRTEGLAVEYCAVVNAGDMQETSAVQGDGSCLMAVALRLGKTRLIDNIEL
ncbi:MAG: pantoate--beta-alanine ligase [Eubacteriales bacterium]|nr:pantoate--beta-alanine ligase [Eubacteriales bacterium]